MDISSVVDLFHQTLWLMVIVISAMIIPGLIVGLLVAMFQAATQINEMSLNFIPRLLITLFSLMAMAPWLLNLLTEFSSRLIREIPYIVG